MAKDDTTATPVVETSEPAEFTLTLEEFLAEIPNSRVEIKAGFTHLCQAEGITGSKYRSEWSNLMRLYGAKPTKLTWSEWIKQGGK